MSSVPQTVLDLVERFERNLVAYRSGQYKEAQVRREFIDPLFRALGWDVDNVLGYAEAYKDVIHEDAIKIGGYTKAPDYCFRVGGARKFFVEAKKPAVRVKEEISPAYQLRRYAWSAKLSLSILTDFEEFAVYDCRVRPVVTDRASKARVLYVRYAEYPERWEEIATIFAKESVLQGSFDKYAESTRRKRGTAEVDAAFLQEIDSWRDGLARNLALRNPSLTPRDLNYAVQRTIDRIIFLRICEDRGIEVYGRLLAFLNGGQVYARLCDLYRQADERYNSGLFHFRHEKGRAEEPDELTPSLIIDDALLKGIIKSLYYPDSPYEFSVLPADILGQVYEQFLGKVIRLTAGHRAKVEYKPVVKKAGGVYYTPTYIVDYIVEHTVGELLKDSTPRKAARLRILDPACGSGSFLLGAYQRLLDWHRDWYVSDGPESWATRRSPRVYEGRGGEWRLTTGERKRILLNNIYGVDIDSQAVEVTKLSLLLKVLEGESGETLRRQLAFFRERALPDLATNIKCGNSLIGTDFYEGQQMTLLDEEEVYRVNAFDWETEFSEIMAGGGFDAVIGNPPYLFGEQLSGADKSYFADGYDCAHGQYDTYWLFAERGISLANANGMFSMIVPDALLARDEAQVVRRLFLDHQLESLYHCGQVFQGVGVSALVYVVSKKRLATSRLPVFTRAGDVAELLHQCDGADFAKDTFARFTMYVSKQDREVLQRIDDHSVALGDLIQISRGEEIGKKSVLSEGPIPILVGEDVKRYHVSQPSRYVGKAAKSELKYRAPKIVMVKTGRTVVAAVDREGFVTMQSLYNIHAKDTVRVRLEYILAHLDSRLVRFYAHKQFTSYKKLFPQFNQTTVKQLPIRTIDFSDPDDAGRHDRMVALVEQMLALHSQLAAAKTPTAKTALHRQIDPTDRQIDNLVYELYSLTEEEIEIVKGAL